MKNENSDKIASKEVLIKKGLSPEEAENAIRFLDEGSVGLFNQGDLKAYNDLKSVGVISSTPKSERVYKKEGEEYEI